MVLMGNRCTEQGENAVAGRLHDIAVIMLDRVDHQVERRIDHRTRLFWVEPLHQFHRALDVGEESCDGFAFAVD
jgi:hypothetical protein